MRKVALIVGVTGMAGQAFYATLRCLGYRVVGLSRKGSDIALDLNLAHDKLAEVISTLKPDLIINCAALVSISYCDQHPEEAELINSIVPGVLALAASKNRARFIHISTDHYYIGKGDVLHSEQDQVTLPNRYAETKYIGEINALKNEEALVVRTNITGYRNRPESPTFIEWLTDSIIKKKPMTLFEDFFTSTIDTFSLSRLCMLPGLQKESGIYNIASSCSLSKKDFALLYAKELGVDIHWAETGSVAKMSEKRANSLGLNCQKFEAATGARVPSPMDVVRILAMPVLPVPRL